MNRAALSDLEQRAKDAIVAAFAPSEPPALEQVENDHCPECCAVSEIFAGKRWAEVTVTDLIGNPAVSLLPPPAFRYYLPALMLRCIEAPAALDCLPSALVSALSPPNGKPRTALLELRAQLGEARRAAVRAFLQLCASREKIARFPPETFDSAPTSKPLARAIAYWG